MRAGIDAIGLELFADPAFILDPLTTIVVPDGIDGAQVQRQLHTAYNIEIGGGLGDLQGKIWRIGLMGESCKASNVLLVLSALEHTLSQQGYTRAHRRRRGGGAERPGSVLSIACRL